MNIGQSERFHGLFELFSLVGGGKDGSQRYGGMDPWTDDKLIFPIRISHSQSS